MFLDIDGTLWDNKDTLYWQYESANLNPDSVIAVNNLITELQKRNFDPIFVIISKKRANWEECQNILYSQGIRDDINMYSLPRGNYTRGERISLFLYDHSKGKDISTGTRHFSILDKINLNYAMKVDNYVVIDDDRSALFNIPRFHHIQTFMCDRCLDMDHVNEFLNNLDHNFELEPEQ